MTSGHRLTALLALLAIPALAAAQQRPSLIQRAEREIWDRLEARARVEQALVLDSSQIDLRIPIDGWAWTYAHGPRDLFRVRRGQ